MMQEAQRLAYLNALGITQYVPLAPIAGAPVLPVLQEADDPGYAPEDLLVRESTSRYVDESMPVTVQPVAAPDFEAEEADTEKAVAGKTVTVPQQAFNDIPAASNIPAASDIPVLDLSKVKPEPAPVTAPAKPAAGLRFALAVVTLPQRLRLIVELAQPDAPGFSAQEHRLVSDLLLALDAKTELNDSATKLFRWPLVNNPRIAADASATRDALFAFLAGAQEAQAVPAIAFIGTRAVRSLHSAEPGSLFELPGISGRCLVTHSLKDIQQDWRLKPALWSHLHSLLSPAS
ncbi:MAG TPA: hypothetical protein VFX11_19325 [Candidatus Kapabacteria bacterium]|nr:hypothetical protein [Candidatus Kapabacteria bacterium]